MAARVPAKPPNFSSVMIDASIEKAFRYAFNRRLAAWG
jgi:hypothetical protein